jgi:hypothetical protein
LLFIAAIYTSAEVQVYIANIQCREVNLVFPPMQVKDNAGIVGIINNFKSYASDNYSGTPLISAAFCVG